MRREGVYRLDHEGHMIPTVTIATLVDVHPRVETNRRPPGIREKSKAIFYALQSIHPVVVHREALDQLVQADEAYLIRVRVNDETIFEMRLMP